MQHLDKRQILLNRITKEKDKMILIYMTYDEKEDPFL